MQGFVYVLVNSSIPGLCKVGKTTRSAAERGAELSSATGVATPFVVAFEQWFEDCDAAEARVHAALDARGWRVSANREFFRGAAAEVVRVVLEAAEVLGSGPGREEAERSQAASAQAFLEAGDRALYGLGDTLQDADQALRCYKQAMQRGSALAYERVGGLLARAQPGSRADRQKALRLLNEGLGRGNDYCLCQLGVLYERTGHVKNFEKAWALFFRRMAERPGRDEAPERFLLACRLYLNICLGRGLPVTHVDWLRPHGAALVDSYLAALDGKGEDEGAARATLIASMRWVQAELMPPGAPLWGGLRLKLPLPRGWRSAVPA